MSFAVTIENDSVKTFSSAEDAVAYAASKVYFCTADSVRQLKLGYKFMFHYGFVTGEIVRVS